MASDECTPLWTSLDCTAPPTGETCMGFNITTTNPEEIADALVSRGIKFETAAALAMQACRGVEMGNVANQRYLLTCAALVFFMQAGFAMLCAGSVRSKNTVNILLKNVLDACVGTLCYYFIGYGVAYGRGIDGSSNPFIGSGAFALSSWGAVAGMPAASGGYVESVVGTGWDFFLFQWTFAAATATIVSGSMAERTTIVSYLCYSIFLTSFIYPTLAHWVWDSAGWLSAFHADPLFGTGMIDFAGSGVVHMTGGFAGFLGAYFVGPRIGRFSMDGEPQELRGHSQPLVVLGTFILWFGWYGFNPGSYLVTDSAVASEVIARTAVVTTMAAGTGGTSALFIQYIRTHEWNLVDVCNGLLAGLVSITACCSVVEPWAAIIIGFLGAIVFFASSKLLLKLKVDDPLEACPMHGFCGMLSVFMTGLLAQPDYVEQAYGAGVRAGGYGAFYGGGGSLLACQVIGIFSILGWISLTIVPVFFALSKFKMIRVNPAIEIAGLDVSKHGGTAYTHVEESMDDQFPQQKAVSNQVAPETTSHQAAAESTTVIELVNSRNVTMG